MSQKKCRLIYQTNLPTEKQLGDNCIVIYDRVLLKQPGIKKWLKKLPRTYAVKSGEKLKSIDQFPTHVKKILQIAEGLSNKNLTVVSVGGGSVSDFSGFVASILKRGVKLIHVPSTWLSAIDSAHGGKTALNVGKYKNQIGTFYPGEKVFLIKSILVNLPETRIEEAFGEVIKIALIEGGKLWSQIKNKPITAATYWQNLPLMIQAKYKVVSQDPFEKKGLRQILNLGHTMGHVWEAKFKLQHGIAVLYGVSFALEWSYQKKLISPKAYYEIRLSEMGSAIPDKYDLYHLLKKSKNFKKYLLQDKKINSKDKINFIFIQDIGKVVRKSVAFSDIQKELLRQSA